MAHVIAVAGKGGVGKTTLCGLLIQYLCDKKKTRFWLWTRMRPNLNEVLGVDVEMTLERSVRMWSARRFFYQQDPAGMSKADYMEMMVNRCLIEDDDFDMLVMGRTQEKAAGLLCKRSSAGSACKTDSQLSVYGSG